MTHLMSCHFGSEPHLTNSRKARSLCFTMGAMTSAGERPKFAGSLRMAPVQDGGRSVVKSSTFLERRSKRKMAESYRNLGLFQLLNRKRVSWGSELSSAGWHVCPDHIFAFKEIFKRLLYSVQKHCVLIASLVSRFALWITLCLQHHLQLEARGCPNKKVTSSLERWQVGVNPADAQTPSFSNQLFRLHQWPAPVPRDLVLLTTKPSCGQSVKSPNA